MCDFVTAAYTEAAAGQSCHFVSGMKGVTQ